MPYSQTLSRVAPIGIWSSIGGVDDLLSLSDEALLELSLQRPGAFEILVARYQSQFLSRAQSVTRSRDTAEDVVQDTFVRIYRFAPRFRGEEGSFRAWSLTILMNVARTHYAKQARQRGQVASLDPEHYESLADLSVPDKEGHEGYAKEVIEKALALVSPEVAQILTLAYIDDLPYAEIAVRLSISVPAVKTRVHRAKAELRKVVVQE